MDGSDSPRPTRVQMIGRALRSRNYRLFFFGQGVSLVGTWMQRMALLWLVGSLYSDPHEAALWLGIVAFSGQIPGLVVTPLAGVLADRWNRHRTLLGTQTVMMVQALVLAALTLGGHITITEIILLALWLGTANAVDIPTRQAFVIEMVDSPDDLSNAIALNSSIVNAGRLVGPALGGLLVAVFSPGICFAVNGVSFLAVIVALLAMRLMPAAGRARRQRALHDLAEGLRYAFSSPPIRSLLLLLSLVSLAGLPYNSLLPVFVKHVLGSGARSFGLLMAGVGVGALIGALYLASRSSARGLGRVIAAAPALLGAALVAFALSRRLWLSLALAPLLGLGQMLLMAAGNTVLQTIVDDDKRGRVMSLYALAFMGMMPLGNLVAGAVASRVGAPLTVAVGGGVCLAGAALFASRLPALRAVVRPIYVSKGIIPEVAEGLAAGAETPPLGPRPSGGK